MDEQRFGGEWSDEKLQVLRDYLIPYLDIFSINERAKHLHPIYVDAFAGCGTRTRRDDGVETNEPGLFDSAEDRQEAAAFATSSPRIALELPRAFSRYVFIEANKKYAERLKSLIADEYPERASLCEVRADDANSFLPEWCRQLNRNERAVAFLDPYGTEVKWATVEALAHSEKVDLWVLLPVAGIIRMLPNSRRPEPMWEGRLTEFLGTDEWRDWYKSTGQSDLFGESDVTVRELSANDFAKWMTQRLDKVFTRVVPEPLILRNSKGSPLFMLMFAAGNPRGAPTACKIAADIISKYRNRR